MRIDGMKITIRSIKKHVLPLPYELRIKIIKIMLEKVQRVRAEKGDYD